MKRRDTERASKLILQLEGPFKSLVFFVYTAHIGGTSS